MTSLRWFAALDVLCRGDTGPEADAARREACISSEGRALRTDTHPHAHRLATWEKRRLERAAVF